MQQRTHPLQAKRATVANVTRIGNDRRMSLGNAFAIKFTLALKALGLSRGRAAASLQVDKSLVGRWASGTVRPSDHNLANITRLVAQHIPGFTMNVWERDLAGFAERIGVDFDLA